MMHRQGAAGLLALMATAADALTCAGVPFALAGGAAAYARGGTPPEHDVDFVIRPQDVRAATTALAGAGLRVVDPPEDWLVKAFDGDAMLDVIFCLSDEPVTADLLGRAGVLEVQGVRLPVLAATDLAISWLRAFSEDYADFGRVLAMVRPIREQADWAAVRAATRGSAFADAFLVLLERLHVIDPEEVPGRG